MILWFPTRVDDNTCLIYLTGWIHTQRYRYLHRMQDVLNARFPSYDKRKAEVEIHNKTLRLRKKTPIHYEINQQHRLGETIYTALPHANI